MVVGISSKNILWKNERKRINRSSFILTYVNLIDNTYFIILATYSGHDLNDIPFHYSNAQTCLLFEPCPNFISRRIHLPLSGGWNLPQNYFWLASRSIFARWLGLTSGRGEHEIWGVCKSGEVLFWAVLPLAPRCGVRFFLIFLRGC